MTTTATENEPAPKPTVERSRDTAKQFIIDYFEAYEEGLRTGSAEPMEGLATEDCAKCAGITDGLAELGAAGRRHPDAKVAVLPFESRTGADPRVMLWTIEYDSVTGDMFAGNERVEGNSSTTSVYFHLELRHDGRRWQMNGMATERDLREG